MGERKMRIAGINYYEGVALQVSAARKKLLERMAA
jgi:hypothetical protein